MTSCIKMSVLKLEGNWSSVKSSQEAI